MACRGGPKLVNFHHSTDAGVAVDLFAAIAENRNGGAKATEHLLDKHLGHCFVLFVSKRECIGPLGERINTGEYVHVSSG